MEHESAVIYGQPEITNLVYSHLLKLRFNVKDKMTKRHTRSYNEDIKLLLSELNFITRYVTWGDKPIRIVYIGAAPGFHLAKLMKLFRFEYNQMIYFDLYDDQQLHPDLEHYIEENTDQVTMYRELFTIETCTRYIDTGDDVYLITDNRDPKYNKDPIFGSDKESKLKWQNEKEESYANDMEFQKQVCIAMRPLYSCLRFRPKHFYSDTMTEDESLSYLKGTVWLMLFGDFGSTETRLVTNDYDKIDYQWSLKNYQYRLNYYNADVRESLLLNPLTKEQTPLPNMLGNMFEPVMVFVQLIEYLNSIGIATKSIRLKTLMDMYTNFIMVDFCSDSKGLFKSCTFNDVHSAGTGDHDQSCMYIDPSLELID